MVKRLWKVRILWENSEMHCKGISKIISNHTTSGKPKDSMWGGGGCCKRKFTDRFGRSPEFSTSHDRYANF